MNVKIVIIKLILNVIMKSILSTKKHKNKKGKVSTKLATKANPKSINVLKCDCGANFAHKSSLSRHKKVGTCPKEITILKDQMHVLMKAFEEVTKRLDKQQYITLINNGTINNSPNYSISIRNYIQTNYADAPAINKFTKFLAI